MGLSFVLGFLALLFFVGIGILSLLVNWGKKGVS